MRGAHTPCKRGPNLCGEPGPNAHRRGRPASLPQKVPAGPSPHSHQPSRPDAISETSDGRGKRRAPQPRRLCAPRPPSRNRGTSDDHMVRPSEVSRGPALTDDAGPANVANRAAPPPLRDECSRKERPTRRRPEPRPRPRGQQGSLPDVPALVPAPALPGFALPPKAKRSHPVGGGEVRPTKVRGCLRRSPKSLLHFGGQGVQQRQLGRSLARSPSDQRPRISRASCTAS